MALVPQTDEGDAVGANAYPTLAQFKAYHDARGNAYSAFSDPQIEAAIVRATQFLDQRYSYEGVRLTGADQETEFPRTCLYDLEGNLIEGVPRQVIYADCEYAFAALTSPLQVTVVPEEDGRLVIRKREKVGEIEEETEYESGASVSGEAATIICPAGDGWLIRSGFIVSLQRTAGR